MKKITVMAAMLLSVLTGCQVNHDETGDSDQHPDGSLRVTTRIDKKQSNSLGQSGFSSTPGFGPVLGSGLPVYAEIGVCIHAFDGEDYVPYPSVSGAKHQNQLWKNTSGGWRYLDNNGDQTAYYLSSTDAYLHTYYPYTSNIEVADAEGLKLKVRPGYIDYMYGKALSNPNAQNPNSKLQLKHALASITFTIQSQGYTGNCLLEAITLHNVIAEGDLAVRTGEISMSTQKRDVAIAKWCGAKYDPIDASGNSGFETPISFSDRLIGYPTINKQPGANSLHIMVIPQRGVSEIKPGSTYLSVRVDGIVHEVPFVKNSNGQNVTEFDWMAGKNFNYNLIMNANGGLTLEVKEYNQGGEWEIDFTNPNQIVNEGGAEDIKRPTHFLEDQDKISKHFEISLQDTEPLSWFEASGWLDIWGNNNHGTVNPNPTKGCLALREGGHSDWRMPTFNEYKLMFGLETIKNPLNGSYWVGDYAYHRDASIIENMERKLIKGATQHESKYSYKVRCIRDIR